MCLAGKHFSGRRECETLHLPVRVWAVNAAFIVMARLERGCADDDDAGVRALGDADEGVINEGAVPVARWRWMTEILALDVNETKQSLMLEVSEVGVNQTERVLVLLSVAPGQSFEEFGGLPSGVAETAVQNLVASRVLGFVDSETQPPLQ